MAYKLNLTYPKYLDEGMGSIRFLPFNFKLAFNPGKDPETGNFTLLLESFEIELTDIELIAESGEVMEYISIFLNYIKEGLMKQLKTFLQESLMGVVQPMLAKGLGSIGTQILIGQGKAGDDVFLDYGFSKDPTYTAEYMAFPILGAVHVAGKHPPPNEHVMPEYNKTGEIQVFVGDYILATSMDTMFVEDMLTTDVFDLTTTQIGLIFVQVYKHYGAGKPMYLSMSAVKHAPIVDLSGSNTSLKATVQIDFYAEKPAEEAFLNDDPPEIEYELAFTMETEIIAELDFSLDKDFTLLVNVAEFDLEVTHLNVFTIEEITRKDVQKVLKFIKSLVRPLINQLFG